MSARIIQFIRHAPIALLREYFSGFSVTAKIDWHSNNNNKQILKPLLEAIDSLKKKDRLRVDDDVERILIMTDELGQAALDSVISDYNCCYYYNYHGSSYSQTFSEIQGNYQLSLWAFLNDHENFKKAEDIRHADLYLKDSVSDGFVGPKHIDILQNLERERITIFEEKIKKIFNIAENIKVEILNRYLKDKLGIGSYTKSYQLIIHYNTSSTNYRAFEEGKIVNKFIHPVEELVIIYDPSNGQINIISKGEQCKIAIAKAFANTLLSSADNKGRISLMRYKLDKLLQSHNFVTLPEDGIESVKVSYLLFQGLHNNITFAIKISRSQRTSIYDISERILKTYDSLRLHCKLIRATLLIRFQHQQSKHSRSVKLLSLTIGSPNICSLESKSPKDLLIINKYLKMWELVEEL